MSTEDADAFARMLDDDADIEALLRQVESRHAMDVTGPVMTTVSRIRGLLEAVAIDVRLLRRQLGGA